MILVSLPLSHQQFVFPAMVFLWILNESLFATGEDSPSDSIQSLLARTVAVFAVLQLIAMFLPFPVQMPWLIAGGSFAATQWTNSRGRWFLDIQEMISSLQTTE